MLKWGKRTALEHETDGLDLPRGEKNPYVMPKGPEGTLVDLAA
jgi:hypothetical protein